MFGAAEGAGEEEAATGELWHKLKFKQTRRRGGKSRLPHPHNLRISLSVSLFWRLSSPLSPCRLPFGRFLFVLRRKKPRRSSSSAFAAKTRRITTTNAVERGELKK